jgi:hypothetical protein
MIESMRQMPAIPHLRFAVYRLDTRCQHARKRR